jgi:hypothetical protein
MSIINQRTPSYSYINILYKKHDIPYPTTVFNSADKLWGTFIEEMVKKGDSEILSKVIQKDTFKKSKGYVVTDITATSNNNRIIFNKNRLNVTNGSTTETIFNVIGGSNVVINKTNDNEITINVPSVGSVSKFSSTENGTGSIGSTGTYLIADATPFIVGETLAVGSVVYLANNYTIEVTGITPPNYTGVVINVETNIKSDWNAVAGSDAEILNKPTIPSAANNATITLKNGSTIIDTFTVDAATNKDIDLSSLIPTQILDVTLYKTTGEIVFTLSKVIDPSLIRINGLYGAYISGTTTNTDTEYTFTPDAPTETLDVPWYIKLP